MTNYPTEWQRRVLWTVLAYLAIVAAGVVAVSLLVALGRALGFLQPVLIPFALAAVLAFLLDPIVRVLTSRTRLSRTGAVIVLFLVIILFVLLAGVLVLPRMYSSSVRFVEDLPGYTQKTQERLVKVIDATETRIETLNKFLPGIKATGLTTPAVSPAPAGSPAPAVSPSGVVASATAAKPEVPPPNTLLAPNGIRNYIVNQLPAVEGRIPAVLDSVWHLAIKSIGGVLGAAGALLAAFIVPVYLYFLLVESPNIARHWNEYLPIRDSPFKKEVVSVLLEVNGYLVAFFRGQLLVSSIDGLLVGLSLALFVHLDFAWLIGLLVVVLTFVPYLGILLCYIPAVLAAIIQFGDWGHPLAVAATILLVQVLEGTVIAPKIIGDSVGLHPMTVILSVFGWSLLLNGPLGAILAVPLSATVKVLLRRYVWAKGGRGPHLMPLTPATAAGLEDVSRKAREASQEAPDREAPRIIVPGQVAPVAPAPAPIAPPAA